MLTNIKIKDGRAIGTTANLEEHTAKESISVEMFL